MGKREFKVKGAAEVQRTCQLLNHGEIKMGGFIIVGLPQVESAEDIELVNHLKRHSSNRPVIMLAGNNSDEQIEAALNIGVGGLFNGTEQARFVVDKFKSAIVRSGERNETMDSDSDGFVVGENERMKKIKGALLKISQTDCNVLLTGETGTGKDVAAEFIHRNSARCTRPFLCVNCTAFPETLLESELFGYEKGAFTSAVSARPGKFEMASGGSLFLDEIGDMGINAQAKILRTIEKKEIWRIGGEKPCSTDFRLIAATNRDPEHLIHGGQFREDLYYRLNIARVHLPSLRDRMEDMEALVGHILRVLNSRFNASVREVSKDVMALFLSYSWPGNIRQLNNVIEASYINSPRHIITLKDLPESFMDVMVTKSRKTCDEFGSIEKALTEAGGNISKAATLMNVSRMTLYRKMARYGIIRK